MRIPFLNKITKKSPRGTWIRLVMVAGIILILSGITIGGNHWHNQPGFCSNCHTPMTSYVNNYYSHDSTLLITKHAFGDTTNIKCLDCHTQTLNEQLTEGAHWVTGNYTFPLEKREFGTRNTCMAAGCHVESDIIEATKHHDNTLFAYNQHDPRHGKLQCNSCHSMHGTSTLSCNQCHNFELPDGWVAPQPNGMITSNLTNKSLD
ncbi:cytochrome c3 family protein [Plebeiibacterium sediminum]|uniref:Cytochrome c3 family protein n=1 Tax=Plebeiibacterium sediminum TaxID=2992112 RepID=A0AAE3M5P4_9BACT|nr:cytochrome c3 family protein [Plebeiobacterium sediminum]MCW3787314.1 cytochrome c3 family protein [Plebeiobacterium sediminum]